MRWSNMLWSALLSGSFAILGSTATQRQHTEKSISAILDCRLPPRAIGNRRVDRPGLQRLPVLHS